MSFSTGNGPLRCVLCIALSSWGLFYLPGMVSLCIEHIVSTCLQKPSLFYLGICLKKQNKPNISKTTEKMGLDPLPLSLIVSYSVSSSGLNILHHMDSLLTICCHYSILYYTILYSAILHYTHHSIFFAPPYLPTYTHTLQIIENQLSFIQSIQSSE